MAAIGAIFSLAGDDDIRREIRELGGIGNLVSCLEDTTDKRIPRQACGALLNMANDDECRQEIRDYGGIELILKLLENQFDDEVSLEYGTGALLNLSSDDETRDLVRDANGGVILSRCLKESKNSEVKRNTVGAIAQLCFDPTFTRQIISEGCLPAVIECLDSEDEETRNRTSGCIWNLSVTSDETREALAREGCLERLIGLLERHESVGEDVETVGNCVMCLSILSSNDMVSETLREMDGCFELIVKLMTHPDETISQNAAAAVWNLAHNDENKKKLLTLDTMACLIPLLESFGSAGNWEALEKVLGAVLTCSSNDTMADQFREQGGFPPLKTIIEDKLDPKSIQNEQHQKCVLYGIIGFAVLAYNEKNKDEIRECGALADLIELLRLDYNEDLLEKDTAALLNLTHNVENRVAIRKLDGIAPLIELMFHPNEQISQNAAGCLWNCSNDPGCKTVIQKLGGLKPLLTLIGGGKVNPKSKKDRAISQKEIDEANRGIEEEEEPAQPEEPFGVDEMEEFINPKAFESLDDQDTSSDKDLMDYSRKQRNRNGDTDRTTTGAGVEYGEETGMEPGKIIVGAARIDIKRRRKQADREREIKEAEEREARRKEREERERERQRKEEEERKRKEEEEKKRQKEEEEKKKKLELEMKKKAEEEAEKERQRLLAEAEATKNKNDAFDPRYKRKGAKDEDVDWDEIYPEGFDPSATKDQAKEKLEASIDEYRHLIDPLNEDGIRNMLSDKDLEFIESELDDAKKFLEKNPNATMEQIDDRRRALDATIKPMVEAAKERKVLTDMTQSLKDRLLNDPDLLKNLTPEERKELEEAIREMEQWLKDNPNATKEEIEEKQRELLNKIKPILARAQTRNDLENYAHDLRKKINDDDDMMFDLLGDEDKGTLLDAIREIEDYLLEHPHATAQDLQDKLDETKKRVDPILAKAKAKKDLLDYVAVARDRLNNDDKLNNRITPEEKRAIQTALDDFDKWIKNHPNTDVENLKKQKQRLKQKLEPIITRADAHNSLEDYNHRMKKRIEDPDDLGDLLDDMDKKQVQKEIKDSEDFLKKVEKDPSKFTADDINNKKKEMKEKVMPLLEKAEKRKDLKDLSQSIRDRINDSNDLAKYVSPKDKKTLENECKEVEDWVKNNKRATPQQVDEKKKKFQEKTKPILEGAELRKQLDQYADRLQDRLDDKAFVEKLKPEEKRALTDAVNEMKTFLKNNPEASAKQVEEFRDKTNDTVLPILERVREQDSLAHHVANVRDKVRDDPQLSKYLSEKEKKAIQKAADDAEKILKSKPSAEQAKKAKNDFSDAVKPLIDNALARSKLAQHADNVVDEVLQDPFTSDKDKEAVKKAKKDLIDDFLSKNPDATKEQVEAQKKKFDDAVAPITERIQKKKQLEGKIADVKRKLEDPDSALCTKTTPEERQYLAGKVEEMEKFLKDNPNASIKQLDDKLNDFASQVDPIVKTAEKRAELEQKANNIRDRLVNPNDDLCKYLNDGEKKQLRDATQEALSFLEKNPNCSATDVASAKKKLDDKTKELSEKAKARGGLYRKAGGLLRDANDFGEDGLGSKLNSIERDDIIDKSNEIINFLDKNPNLTTKQIKEKEKELNKVVKPIVEKIKERENLRDLVQGIRNEVFDIDEKLETDTDENKSVDHEDELEDLLAGPTRQAKSRKDEKAKKEEKLGDFLNQDEKKKLDETTRHVLDMLDTNPNMTISDLKKHARDVKKDTDSILEAAKSRSALKDYLNKVREDLADEKGLLANNLNETDKKLIENAVNETLDWLGKEGANASSEAVEKKKKDLINKIDPVMQKAKERGELESIANRLRQRLDEDVDLSSALSDKDRKAIEKEVKDVLDFLAERPNASREEIQKRRKHFDETVVPILEKTEARNKLKNYANDVRGRIYDQDDLGNKLTENEKKVIDKMVDEALDFLETNPDASKDRIDQKRHALEAVVNPMINKAEKAKSAESYANDVRDRLENDQKLKDSLTPDERNAIDVATKELLDWLDKNGATATENEIRDKERQCREKVDPILNKAKVRQDLKDQADKLKEKLNQDPEVSGLKLTDEEKKALQKHINDVVDYLDTVAKNPNTSADQVKDKLNDFKLKTNPIVEKAKERRNLEKYASGVRDRIKNDEKLSQRLTPEEKRVIDNAAKEVLDWVRDHSGNASLFDIKEKKRAAQEKIEPAMQRAQKHQELEEYVNNVRDKINGDLKDKMSPEERKLVDQETQKVLDWLSKNKTAPISEVEAQKRSLEQKIAPIMEKAQAKKDLENFANSIRDRLVKDKELANLLSKDEKKAINDAAQEALNWLKQNPNASLSDIKNKKKKLEDVVNNILDDKEAAQNFRNYIDKVLEVLQKNKQVQKNLTEEEKRAIQDFAEEARDWLTENPNATARQIRMERKKLEEKLAKIKKFKFEVPTQAYLGFGFTERLRWGDESKRTKDISQYYGSYLKKDQPKTPVKPVSSTPKPIKINIPPKKPLSKEEEDELNLFNTMKFNKGGLIQAKLQSLMGSVGSAGAVSGTVIEEEESEPAVVFSYAELKNNSSKKYPQGIDMNKREQYLSNEEFAKVFKMSRDEFKSLPEFRQTKLKRDADLFAYAYEL